MIRRTVVTTAVMFSGVLLVAGCSVAPAEEPSTAPVAVVTDADTCVAFGDVRTIQFNAELGYTHGRMDAQEQTGWLELSTRVLDRVPTTGIGEVSDAAAALKQAAPVIRPGATGPLGFGSTAWDDAHRRLIDACADAGSEVATVAFIGG